MTTTLPQVLPVYCYDPRFFAPSPFGLSKTGPHRAAFLQACVSDLHASLQQLGSGLLVSVGAPEAVIASALEGAAAGGSLVLTQQEVTSEELDVDAAVRRAVKVRKGQEGLIEQPGSCSRHWRTSSAEPNSCCHG